MTDKLNVLLLVGGAWYHDQPEHRQALSSMLQDAFALTLSDDPAVLTAKKLARYDVIADYSSWWEPSEAQNQALLDAVAGGTGYVCLHPASASFWNSSDHLDMIGGRFIMHDPYKAFVVEVGKPDYYTRRQIESGALQAQVHPIVEGIADFEVADELFYIQGNQNEWNILARAEGHPVVFTKSWGQGRVVSIALGHDDRPLSNPNVEQLHIRGIQWAGGAI